MNGSIRIGSAFGIPIQIHWTFLIAVYVLLIASSLSPVVLLVLFGCVLLHELGHSLAARRFGIRVIDITLWPLGGMARLAEMPEDPKIEGIVALAGPAVNFVLAAIGAVLLNVALLGDGEMGALAAMIAWFTATNILMGALNLVPAFPMDGGRVLRAWFARSTDWVSATEQAVRVGRIVALAAVLLSLLFYSQMLCMVPLIAAFVWIAGGRELWAVRMRHGIHPFGPSVAQARTAPPRRPSPAPPTAPSKTEVGVPRRPAVWDPDGLDSDRPGGFDEERIRALERYRGRLRGRE